MRMRRINSRNNPSQRMFFIHCFFEYKNLSIRLRSIGFLIRITRCDIHVQESCGLKILILETGGL